MRNKIINNNWSLKKIEDICPLQRGFDLPANLLKKGKFPVIYSNGIGYYHNQYKVKGPGIVTGRSGTIGKVFYTSENYWPHNTSLWVTDFKGNNPLYIYYFLNWINLDKYDAGTSVPSLNRNSIHSIIKPIAPLPEQKRIAQILSTWDKAIETTEKLIAAKEKLKKGLMQQLLSGKKRFKGFEKEKWEVVTIGDISAINPSKFPMNAKEKVSFIGMADISENATIIRHHEKLYKEVDKGFTSFKEKDVLIAKITPCFENGKGALVQNLINGVGFGSTEFHIVRTNKKCLPEFLYYITTTKAFRTLGEASMTGSAGQKRIPVDFIKAYQIKLPSIQEQKEIINILSLFDAQLKKLTDLNKNLQSQKRGLMQVLLTGKVRVKI